MSKFVKLGSKASFFRDPALDLSIAPGEIVELDVVSLNSRRVKRALNGGHLVYAENPAVKKEAEVSMEDYLEAFKNRVTSGEEASKTLKAFSLDIFKGMAKLMDIEVESSDTKKTIYEALVEEINQD